MKMIYFLSLSNFFVLDIFSLQSIFFNSLFAIPVLFTYLPRDICCQIFPFYVWWLCLLHQTIRLPSPLPLLHFQVPEFIPRNSYQSVTYVNTASSSNHNFAMSIFSQDCIQRVLEDLQ